MPIEIIRFGHVSTTRLVRDLFGDFGYHGDVCVERRRKAGDWLVTDSGNFIIDAHLQQITRAAEPTVELNGIPGVVENGLFVGISRDVVFGHPDSTADVYSLPLDPEGQSS